MFCFTQKVFLITGGTGLFGNAVLKRLLDSDIKEIRIFSRDRHGVLVPRLSGFQHQASLQFPAV
jgi:FlaA1/EpsC-like NDP-sugar epimerase